MVEGKRGRNKLSPCGSVYKCFSQEKAEGLPLPHLFAGGRGASGLVLYLSTRDRETLLLCPYPELLPVPVCPCLPPLKL